MDETPIDFTAAKAQRNSKLADAVKKPIFDDQKSIDVMVADLEYLLTAVKAGRIRGYVLIAENTDMSWKDSYLLEPSTAWVGRIAIVQSELVDMFKTQDQDQDQD